MHDLLFEIIRNKNTLDFVVFWLMNAGSSNNKTNHDM